MILPSRLPRLRIINNLPLLPLAPLPLPLQIRRHSRIILPMNKAPALMPDTTFHALQAYIIQLISNVPLGDGLRLACADGLGFVSSGAEFAGLEGGLAFGGG
jgi:hypothetical protein